MDWREDASLATRMIEDLGEEIRLEKSLPHLTELVYCLTRSWYNRFKPLPPNPKETMIFVVGVGLEKVLLKSHRQHITGERDGIHYDMDFLDYNDNVGELKSTRISLNKFLERCPGTWKRQVLGYMYTEGKVECTLGVIHLMGSYAPPFPELMAWHGRASKEELQANWDWLVGRKDIYLGYVERQEVPPQFTYNEDFECGNCGYKIICDARQAVKEMA